MIIDSDYEGDDGIELRLLLFSNRSVTTDVYCPGIDGVNCPGLDGILGQDTP